VRQNEVISLEERAKDKKKAFLEQLLRSCRIRRRPYYRKLFSVERPKVNSLWISTVFLGLNHNYYAEGPPLWFETIVFEEKDGKRERSSRFVRHYTTWAEVEPGHRSMVEIIGCGNF
jgi:hypothetical protein